MDPVAGEHGPPSPTVARLVDAAAAALAERGYDGAGVHEIAARAGLTTGAIYANFRGKADLLAAAIASRAGPALDALLGLDTRGDAARPGPVLAGGPLVLPPASVPDGGLLVEALVAARRDPEVAALVGPILAERRDALGQALDDARVRGTLAEEVSADAASALALALALGSLLLGSPSLGSLRLGLAGRAGWETLLGRLGPAFAPVPAPQPPAPPQP